MVARAGGRGGRGRGRPRSRAQDPTFSRKVWPAPVASAERRSSSESVHCAGVAAVVEGGLADELDLDLPSRHSTVRTSMWSASSSAGGRVCGVTCVLVIPGPDRQRVSDEDPAGRRLPGRQKDVRARLVDPGGRMVDPERREAEEARLTVEQAPEDARRVEATESRASRSRRRARRARRCGSWRGTRSRRSAGTARALPRFAGRLGATAPVLMLSIQGPCQRPYPASSSFACLGSPRPRRVRMDGRRGVEQRLHDPPLLLDRVLAGEADGLADQSRVEQDLVRRRPFAALLRELHVELDRAGAYRRDGPRA